MNNEEKIIGMLEHLTGRVDQLADDVTVLKTGQKQIEQRLDSLDTRVGNIEVKVNSIDARVGNLEVKVDKLDARIANLEVKVDKLDARVANLEDKVFSLDARVGNLEVKVGEMSDRVEVIFDEAIKQRVFKTEITEKVDKLINITELNTFKINALKKAM